MIATIKLIVARNDDILHNNNLQMSLWQVIANYRVHEIICAMVYIYICVCVYALLCGVIMGSICLHCIILLMMNL